MGRRFLLISLVFLLIKSNLFATPPAIDTAKDHSYIEKFYIGSGLDAGIFSTATIKHSYPSPVGGNGYTTNTNGTLRFSYVINYGVTFNTNLNRHFGIYTGIDLKNIGFIEKNNSGETVKRRTYNLGAPLGFKVGNMKRKKSYLFLGGGLDFPVNYKEKVFAVRDQKSKFNEWFSTRTPLLMPYLFIGVKIKSNITFKFQYYPNNYLNPDYVASNGTIPYYGYNVHLILFSLGYDMHFGKHKDDVVKNTITKPTISTL